VSLFHDNTPHTCNDKLLNRVSRELLFHDCLKRSKEFKLEIEVVQLVLFKELLGKLTKGIDSEFCNMGVRMASNSTKMLSERIPDSLPNIPCSVVHVCICYLNKLLQRIDGWVVNVFKLFFRYLAKTDSKMNN